MNVIQISQHFVFRSQSSAHGAQRIVDAQTEEQWHQRISLFPSLGLTDPVLRPCVICPHMRFWLDVNRPHKRERSPKAGHLVQLGEKTAPEYGQYRALGVCISQNPSLRGRRSGAKEEV